MQPGETITPGSQPVTPEEPKQETVNEAPVTSPIPEEPAEVTPLDIPPEASPQSDWQFSDKQEADFGTPDPAIQPVSWTASEYIAHDKGLSWFVVLGVAVAALIGVVYLFTKDFVPSIMVGIAGLTFGIFAARPPKVLNYQVDNRGIQIGQKFYAYQNFKSFSVVDHGPLPSIMLMPLKRFLPPITVYYEPQTEDAVLNVLASYLPHEEKEPDAVDRLMGRIRF